MGIRTHLYRLALTSLCAAITAGGALIVIPLPIPITMQLFGVFLSGFVLGPLYGAYSQIAYILAGLAGLPVFAGGVGGFAILASPTLGYLLAFPIASAIVGYIAHGNKRASATIGIAIACAIVAIYSLGVLYFWCWSRYIAGKPISIYTAISIGALPFIAIDILKGYLAAIIAKRLPQSLLLKEKSLA